MAYKRKKKQPKPPPPRQRSGDYRIFVGAFFTGELADRIQAVREQYDLKTAQITAPHVTIAGTYWRNGRAVPQNESILIRHLATLSQLLAPFTLELGGIYTLGQRVIYLGVKPTEELQKVRTAVINQTGRDKHRQFKPHLTLAMRLKQPAFAEAVNELQQTEWHSERYSVPINTLHLMQRGKNDPAWRSIFSFQLEAEQATAVDSTAS